MLSAGQGAEAERRAKIQDDRGGPFSSSSGSSSGLPLWDRRAGLLAPFLQAEVQLVTLVELFLREVVELEASHADYAAGAGLVAYQSALKDGELLKIPQYKL